MPVVPDDPHPVRYRFGRFVLSPGRRVLEADGREVRLIPRYFDLLLLLIERRHQAVHRQEIFDRVWSDVVVSDGALTQAIRTLRRTLGDDPQKPAFIRTVSRHGYQFVHPELTVEAEAGTPGEARANGHIGAAQPQDDPFAPLLDRLLARGAWRHATDEERRDAGEQLHALGTTETLRRLGDAAGHVEARAILRDARWDVPGAGDVPLSGAPGWPASAVAVVRLRLRRAARLASTRWAAASGGGGLAGIAAGLIGGTVLLLVPDSQATASVLVALPLIGAVGGALGAAGVGAGLAAAEALARSRRGSALVLCGAGGGAVAGLVGHLLGRAVLQGVFGQDLPAMGGGLEGAVLGAAAGAGYALATRHLAGGGMASPRGADRLRAALTAGVCCAAAGVLLATAGRQLVAGSLDLMAARFRGSSVGLAPLTRQLDEEQLPPITHTLISGFEGLLFGSGLVLGLTRRPRVRDQHGGPWQRSR